MYDHHERKWSYDSRRLFNDLQRVCHLIIAISFFTSADIYTYFIFYSYTEHDVTEDEFNKLNPRSQDQLRRSASTNLQASQPQTQPWGYYTPAAQPDRLRRVGTWPFFRFLKKFQSLQCFLFVFFLCTRLVARESIFWRVIERRQLCSTTTGIQGFKCFHYGLDFMIWLLVHVSLSVYFIFYWLLDWSTFGMLVTALNFT